MSTLSDVAKKAGVAVSTASKVLSKSPAAGELTERTKAAVIRAARELKYRPHPIAHSLRTRKTATVGFVAPSIPSEHLGPVARSIQKVLDERGYHLVLASAEQDLQEESYWLEYFSRRVDGLLIAVESGRTEIDAIRRFIGNESLPMVLIGFHPDFPGVSSVAVNGFIGGRRAVKHLVTLGHERIAYLGGASETYENRNRRNGYLAALEESGLAHGKGYIRENPAAGWQTGLYRHGYEQVQSLLSKDPAVTALFAFNDTMACGAVRGAQAMGRRVPEDISIVGFDDLYWTAWFAPPLTTVRQPREELGWVAAGLLLDRLRDDDRGGDGADRGQDPPHRKVDIQPELVIRESTAPPAGKAGGGRR